MPPPRLPDALSSPSHGSARNEGGSLGNRLPVAYGLRARMAEGYGRADLQADILAGLVVGIVALPLSMALGIASGVTPQQGLYTAIVAGIVCALLGGTRCQVTGPTAAFVVILAPIVSRSGVGGLLIAGLLAGIILVLMGLARLGRLIQFIPHPVTTGFTSGIAIVIGTLQLKDFFGLDFGPTPESYFGRWSAMWQARGTISWAEAGIAMGTLGLLVVVGRVQKKIPAPLIALTVMSVVGALLATYADVPIDTVGTRFQFMKDGVLHRGIPSLPPMPVAPWNMGGSGGAPLVLDLATLRQLLGPAFAIAMLGAIESLLAAVVSDGMTGTTHNPDAELLSLGIGNILCPFFGGIAATGALARTATNIRAGARSPISSVVHAIFVLLCMVLLAPLVAYLPMASLAALLLLIAYNMMEVRHGLRILRIAPRSDAMVLVTCFVLTVVFDMVVAVSAGVVLAAILFMKRMAELTDVKLDTGTMAKLNLPPETAGRVRLYEIAGPLFFGAAQKAISVLGMGALQERGQNVILYLAQVPMIDATGLVAFETLLERLDRLGHRVIVAGLARQPAAMLEAAGLKYSHGQLLFAPDLDAALSLAILDPRAGVSVGSSGAEGSAAIDAQARSR